MLYACCHAVDDVGKVGYCGVQSHVSRTHVAIAGTRHGLLVRMEVVWVGVGGSTSDLKQVLHNHLTFVFLYLLVFASL